MNLILATLGIVALVIFVFLMILSPKKTSSFELSDSSQLDPTLARLVILFGGDVSSFFPESVIRKGENEHLKRLIESSSNPWNVTIHEFVIIRLALATAGAISGLIFSLFLLFLGESFGVPVVMAGLLTPVIIVLGGLLGFKYPESTYETEKKRRDKEFKMNLPEAIDYLIMILSGGGYSLPVAFEMSLDYLPQGVVHEEFSRIVSDLHTGKTMENALNDFAERVPSEGIRAFSKALNNANKLSVSVVEILKARAEASRKELELEIEKRLSTLPVKVMLVLSPSSALSIMLVALAPSADAIMNMM